MAKKKPIFNDEEKDMMTRALSVYYSLEVHRRTFHENSCRNGFGSLEHNFEMMNVHKKVIEDIENLVDKIKQL